MYYTFLFPHHLLRVTIKATITIPMDKDVSDLSVYDFDITIESNESDYEFEEFEADIDSIREY